jgi:hypothetical protein
MQGIMKKLFRFNAILWLTAIIVILANIHIASGQTGKKQQFPIPHINNDKNLLSL